MLKRGSLALSAGKSSKDKTLASAGEKERRKLSSPTRSPDGDDLRTSLGTCEKCVLLILRNMFGKPLDILKYGKAAQIRRTEMDVMELEGSLAVPQISLLPRAPNPSPSPWPAAVHLDLSQPAPLVLPCVFPRGGQATLCTVPRLSSPSSRESSENTCRYLVMFTFKTGAPSHPVSWVLGSDAGEGTTNKV